MLACIILLVLGAAALCFYLREKLRACTLRAVFLKVICSLLFVSLAVCAAMGEGSGVPGVFVIPGLVCGLLGDVWLDLKYVYPREDGPYTYAGFASFGLGHVLFIAGLLLRYSVPAGTAALVLACGAGLSLLNALLEKPMKLRYGKFRGVVIVYGALLFSTLLLSGFLALGSHWQDTALNLFFAGALLFSLSDLILSGTYFGVGRDRPVDLALNYLSYYPAQFLIALSLAFCR